MILKLLIGLIGLLAVLVLTSCGLNRFSQAPATLGLLEGRLSPCPESPNCVFSGTEIGSHFILPIKIVNNPHATWNTLQQIIKTSPHAKVISLEPHYLHAEFTSPLMRFIDDVEMVLMEDESLIHIRSASRLGYSDFGQNRQRLELIRKRLIETYSD